MRQQLQRKVVKQPSCPPSPAPTCEAMMGMLLAILYTTRVCHLLKDSVRGKVKVQPDMAEQPLHWVSGVVVLDDANLQKIATFGTAICLHLDLGMGTSHCRG